jgi:hypothetical protein
LLTLPSGKNLKIYPQGLPISFNVVATVAAGEAKAMTVVDKVD